MVASNDSSDWNLRSIAVAFRSFSGMINMNPCFVLVLPIKANGFGWRKPVFQDTNAGPEKTSYCPGICDHRSGGAPFSSKCHGMWETIVGLLRRSIINRVLPTVGTWEIPNINQ